MIGLTEYIVGFSSREIPDEINDKFAQIRHLNAHTKLLLSVDTSIWPQQPDYSDLLQLTFEADLEADYRYIITYHSYFFNLATLQKYLRIYKQVIKSDVAYWIIALSIVTTNLDDFDYLTRFGRSDNNLKPIIEPDQIDETWQRLGYEVVTIEDLWTAHTYYPNKKFLNKINLAMIPYAKDMNDYGLFSDLQKAIEYRDLRNQFHSESGFEPYIVAGIYVVEKTIVSQNTL